MRSSARVAARKSSWLSDVSSRPIIASAAGTLSAEGLGAKPPTAYRALDFLVKHGLAHRIERLNAYTACARPDRDHVPAFLICRACGAVAEAETELTQGRLGQAAEGSGFTIEQVVVEAEGLCPACTGGDT